MRATFAVFIGVILIIDSLAHYYLWTRLFRDPGWPVEVRRIGAVALIGLAILLPVALMTARSLPREQAQPLALTAYVWMGTAFYLLLVLFAVDAARALAGGAHHLWSLLFGTDSVPEPSRRAVLAQATAGAAGLTAVGLSGAALRSGLADVEIKEESVKLARLPKQLDGMTLVQLSDVHVGPTIGKRFIHDLVEKTNAQKPDLVVITGDLVDGSVAALREHVAPLAKLASRYGTFFVTGNHEYYSGAAQWEEELRRLGIRVLRNERVSLGDAARFDLAGIDDHQSRGMAHGHGPKIEVIQAGRDPEQELILLAHQPRSLPYATEIKAGLQLSGHTHGGQLWPFNGMVKLVQPYVAGLHRHDEHTQIYVSRGTGYWGPPMRLAAPAEISKIVLVAG